MSPADGHLMFLHGFEQRALHFRRRAVDFVGQQQVGEAGPRWVVKAPSLGEKIMVPTTSLGSRSGVNWMRLNCAADGSRERLHRQRFGETGDTLNEQMALREDRYHDALEKVVLADHDPLHLVENPLHQRPQFLTALFALVVAACRRVIHARITFRRSASER